ncbi:MAG TPA: antibiotic biosynthesis monooxygenase [Vicinamibacterales bacterium]
MSALSQLLVSALLLVAMPGQQAGTPADTRFYAVSYIEAMASSTGRAIALLKQYRDSSAKQDGFVSIEVFEQLGRPGHFALFEVWRDQKAFEVRDAAVQQQLRDALQPLRVSDYDQRPYKAISVGPTGGDNRRGGRAAASQVIVISHVDVAPNPQVAVMLKDLAEASRKEPGNVRFDVVQHTMRANHFTVVEVWRDQKALDAHVAAPHTRQYRDTLQPMTGSPLDERVYKSID